MNQADLSAIKARIHQCQSDSRLSNRYTPDIAEAVAAYIKSQPETQTLVSWAKIFDISPRTISKWLHQSEHLQVDQTHSQAQAQSEADFFEMNLPIAFENEAAKNQFKLCLGEGYINLDLNQLRQLLCMSNKESSYA